MFHLDKALNLPDDSFEDGEFKGIKVLRRLGFGRCNFKLGVPIELDYSSIEDVSGLRVATALPNLTRRIFRERGISVELVVLGGCVENAYRYGSADAIVDFTETGETMKRNGLKPVEPSLASFEAILLRNNNTFSEGREKMLEKFLYRVDRALKNPGTWINSANSNQNTNEPFSGAAMSRVALTA